MRDADRRRPRRSRKGEAVAIRRRADRRARRRRRERRASSRRSAPRCCSCPSEADIAREIGRDVDPDAIAAAPQPAPRRASPTASATRLAALVDAARTTGGRSRPTPPRPAAARSPTPPSTSWSPTATPAAIARVAERFAHADNMTDRLGGARRSWPQRRCPSGAPRSPPSTSATATIRWSSTSGSRSRRSSRRPRRSTACARSSTTRRSRSPTRTASARWSARFAGGNQTQFNRADGAGYDFLADFVLDLDRRNPQTAARLLVSFRSWRALEPGRRALAETALRRIAAGADLSPTRATSSRGRWPDSARRHRRDVAASGGTSRRLRRR